MNYGRISTNRQPLVYAIEFQNRGLPHAHILLTLNVNAIDIDEVVSAEIPNIQTHPTLHGYVIKHMMLSPCGILNPNFLCMSDVKYKKRLSKTI
jgi:hypothetical protein